MSVVRARTESPSWEQFYSDLLGGHSLDTILLTLSRLRQHRETKLKLKGDIARLCSHWSSSCITALSLV